MLQNARVPTRGRDHLLLAGLIETFNCDSVGTRNQRHESCQAQAAFEEFATWTFATNDARIHNDMEWDRLTLAHAQVFFGNILQILRAIFDDSELDRYAYLRSCESDPRRIAHRFFHVGDEFLSWRATELVDSQISRVLPQDWVADLNNFQLQRCM